MRIWYGFAVLLAVLVSIPSRAEDSLTDLSLEELLTVEVTSVAKKRQRVKDAPAAVFVISSDDIRRSGATRITDLLRMVPGLQVGENDSNSTAVSARGFNERLSNKLLVLVDGRAVYRSGFSGVFWDQILVPLQEIERIEVVRGPGATLWGANAVNGVVNIITKHSVDTLGGTVSGGGGTNELGRVYARWGGELGEDGAYRFYARGDVREGLVDANGNQTQGNSRSFQTGFRIDWEPTDRDALTFQGDVQRGDFRSVVAIDGVSLVGFPAARTQEDFHGFNVLGRWARTNTVYGDFSMQGFVDFLDRGEFGSDLTSIIGGLEFQHTLPKFGPHEVIWGTNVQLTSDDVDGDVISLSGGTNINSLFGLFVQDEIDLIGDELSLTLGTKVERNSLSGFEIQPSARLFWRPSPDFALWGAVSRAVRTPAVFEESIDIQVPPILPGQPGNPGPVPITIGIFGSPDLDAEELYAFELGTRFAVSDDFSFDLAGYVNLYDNLIGVEQGAPVFGPTGILQPLQFQNKGEAFSFGVELSADWKINDWWTLKGAYSYQNIDFSAADASVDNSSRIEGLTPRHQGSLRSQFDLTTEVEFDLWFRAQSGLSESGVAGFFDFDARLAWTPRPDLELSITGRNLAQSRRIDFNQTTYPSPVGQLERSVFGNIEYRF